MNDFTSITKNVTSKELAEAIHEMQFDVWVGEYGYNTLPRIDGFKLSCVAHTVSHADNRLRHLDAEHPSWGPEFIQRQLDEAAETAAVAGTECMLTIREWHGCNLADLHRWITNGIGLWVYSRRDENEEDE